MIRAHHSAIEYDMAGHGRGYDLLDFWRGAITPRWMWMFLNNSPPGSAFHRSLGDGWAVTDYLLAHLIDLGIGAAGDDKTPRFPRPGDVTQDSAKDARNSAGAQRYLERQRAREEAERNG